MDYKELRRRKDIGPYDRSYENSFYLLYDNFTYTMDTDLCGADSHVLISGHLIKYNRYKISDTVLNINSDHIKPPVK